MPAALEEPLASIETRLVLVGRGCDPLRVSEVEAPSNWRTIANNHAGLLISGGLAFVVIYRLLSVAHWDTTTAAAVLQNAGSGNVILGVAISAAPSIITTILWIAGGAFFYRWMADRSWPGRFYLWLTAMTVVLGLTIASVLELLFMLIVWVCAALLGRQDRGRDVATTSRENRKLILTMIVGSTVSLVVMSASSWLPTERIEAGGKPYTAFVLRADTSGDWVVLRNEPREVHFVPPGSSRSRELCDNGDQAWLYRRLPDLFGGVPPADYPHCP